MLGVAVGNTPGSVDQFRKSRQQGVCFDALARVEREELALERRRKMQLSSDAGLLGAPVWSWGCALAQRSEPVVMVFLLVRAGGGALSVMKTGHSAGLGDDT